MEARESASANSVNPDATRELVDKVQRRSTNPPKAARRLFQGPLTKILPSEERSNGMDECQKLKLELTKQNAPDDSEVYVFYLKTGTGRILGPFVFSCHPSKTCKEGEEEKAECSLSASVFATTQQNYCSHCKKPVIVTQEGSFRFFDNAGETAIAEAGCLSPKQRREYIGVKKVLQKLNSVIKDPAPSGQSKEGESVLKPYHDTALSQLLANALGEEGLSIVGSHISMNTNKAVRFNQRMATNPNYQQHLFSLENTVLRLKKDVDRLQTENAHLRSSQPQFVYSYPYGLPSPQSNLIPRYVTPTVVEKAVQYNFEPPTLVDMSVMAEEGLLHEIQTENRAFRREISDLLKIQHKNNQDNAKILSENYVLRDEIRTLQRIIEESAREAPVPTKERNTAEYANTLPLVYPKPQVNFGEPSRKYNVGPTSLNTDGNLINRRQPTRTYTHAASRHNPSVVQDQRGPARKVVEVPLRRSQILDDISAKNERLQDDLGLLDAEINMYSKLNATKAPVKRFNPIK